MGTRYDRRVPALRAKAPRRDPLRHCGKRVIGNSIEGIICGICDSCGMVVARVNPQSGDTERVVDGDAWSRKPREVLMPKSEFKKRGKARRGTAGQGTAR